MFDNILQALLYNAKCNKLVLVRNIFFDSLYIRTDLDDATPVNTAYLLANTILQAELLKTLTAQALCNIAQLGHSKTDTLFYITQQLTVYLLFLFHDPQLHFGQAQDLSHIIMDLLAYHAKGLFLNFQF